MAYAGLTVDAFDKRLLERLAANPYYTTLDRRDALQMARLVWQASVGCWTARIAAPSIAGDWLVPIAGVAQVLGVRAFGTTLVATTIEELSHLCPNWRRTIAGSDGVPRVPRYWAPIGLTTIAIWPVPASDNTLTVDALVVPEALPLAVDGTAILDLAPLWEDAILDLACWWASGKATSGEQDKYAPAFDRYLDAMNRILGIADARDPFKAWRRAQPARLARRTGTEPTETTPGVAAEQGGGQ